MRSAHHKIANRYEVFAFESNGEYQYFGDDWNESKKAAGLNMLVQARNRARVYNERLRADNLPIYTKIELWDNLLNKQVAFMQVDTE